MDIRCLAFAYDARCQNSAYFNWHCYLSGDGNLAPAPFWRIQAHAQEMGHAGVSSHLLGVGQHWVGRSVWSTLNMALAAVARFQARIFRSSSPRNMQTRSRRSLTVQYATGHRHQAYACNNSRCGRSASMYRPAPVYRVINMAEPSQPQEGRANLAQHCTYFLHCPSNYSE